MFGFPIITINILLILLSADTEEKLQNELKSTQEAHKTQVDELQKTSQANLQKAQAMDAVSEYRVYPNI